MIDRRPALIVRCASAADVDAGGQRSRASNGLLLAVRGGGHNIAGSARVRRRPHDRPLDDEVGARRSGRADRARRSRARRSPTSTRRRRPSGWPRRSGINSTTGVAGLTLGGGFGWLSRKYGMTIDNLVSADVVTADGRAGARQRDARTPICSGRSAAAAATSAWSPRSSSGCTRSGPEVLCRPDRPPARGGARACCSSYRRVRRATRRTSSPCWAVMRKAPPLPFLPAEVHGKEIARARAAATRAIRRRAKALLAPLRAFGKPIARGRRAAAVRRVAAAPSIRCSTPGARNYWKSHDFVELGDGADRRR